MSAISIWLCAARLNIASWRIKVLVDPDTLAYFIVVADPIGRLDAIALASAAGTDATVLFNDADWGNRTCRQPATLPAPHFGGPGERRAA